MLPGDDDGVIYFGGLIGRLYQKRERWRESMIRIPSALTTSGHVANAGYGLESAHLRNLSYYRIVYKELLTNRRLKLIGAAKHFQYLLGGDRQAG